MRDFIEIPCIALGSIVTSEAVHGWVSVLTGIMTCAYIGAKTVNLLRNKINTTKENENEND